MISLKSNNNKLNGKVQLESSKSISNRVLIIRALSNQNFNIKNLSRADDTLLMSKIIKSYKGKPEVDCHHAGTTLRFLTAFLSTDNGEWKLMGSNRMHQRPIGPLVDSLRDLGANIKYLEKENHPPILIKGKQIPGGKVDISGDISSQYISALLMIAPVLKNGLKINITTNILSRPYIKMTLEIMHQMGIKYHWEKSSIEIKNQKYKCSDYLVENDWSAASFWYSFVALSNYGKIEIPFLFKSSIQGDSVLQKIYNDIGVNTKFNKQGIIIEKIKASTEKLTLNLADYPDLALPIITTCAGLGIKAHLYGLESLKHKESNRLLMIKNELLKFNIECQIDSSSIKIKANQKIESPNKLIETHHDHRIPMSLAPLCMKIGKIEFINEDVVTKSYPNFWKDCINLGMQVKNI